jgi:predicted acylesterase/phospholipase RssA
MKIPQLFLVALLTALISACSSFSATNVKGEAADSAAPTKATFKVSPEDRGRGDTLVILSLSGGGSRAAYFSTSVMFQLGKVFEEIDILSEVDAISSVSGGSLPAAYYAISTDPDYTGEPPYGRTWDEEEVKELMQRNYIGRWVGNWFWPVNIGKYWFTDYDRTDIMAQTFEDNLYDRKPLGQSLKMENLLPDRPYLILNSTNGTTGKFAQPFTFTREDFEALDSDINAYDLSRAVMASATFPAVFNFMTLKNYTDGIGEDELYTHVFDGGNFDNLGLESTWKILATLSDNNISYERLVVILVDAYADSGGVNGGESDTRKFFDFIVDTNFIDATDSLLSNNRDRVLETFDGQFSDHRPKPKSIFYHIRFADVQDTALRKQLNSIKTDFRIKPEDADAIDDAVEQLLSPDNTCLIGIRDLLIDGAHSTEQMCTFPG